jgi:tRNA pseudouridine38-40 synthase
MTDLERATSGAESFVRVRMLLAYDGKPFRGFAYQPLVTTVAGTLMKALGQIFATEIELTCAGRTDAGVHAWGQVVHFDIERSRFDGVGTDRLQQSLNKICAPSIVIRHVEQVGLDFDARFSAQSRLYHYTVLNSDVPNPFLVDRAWWVPDELDWKAMNRACVAILGEHDFSSFCRRPDKDATLVRNIKRADWTDPEPNILRFEIEANAFCHQMVRALTGMCVAIGMRKRRISDMAEVLDEMDRGNAAPLAPPQGLTLWQVFY